MEGEATEIACWGAACTALATIAPRYGLMPPQVRQLCESGACEGESDLERLQMMTAFLVQGISQHGADKTELIGIAQEAFRAHLKLQQELTVSDLF